MLRSAPATGRGALRHEEDAEVVVGDRQVLADDDVGGDQPARPGELPLAPLDPPGDRAVPEAGSGPAPR